MAPRETLKVVTLNCWGIPSISKNIRERLDAICEQLRESEYDIVALQEIWSQDQYTTIIEKCSQVLPYSHYFHSGMIGAGICVFSKHPLTHAITMPYVLNGRPNMITHGDWFAGKSVGVCRVHVEDWNRSYVVMVTHTHAEYSYKHLRKEYLVHRTAQFCELAMIANTFSDFKSTSGSILLGDFNCRPDGLGCTIIKNLSGMHDSWVYLHGPENEVLGATSDRPDNIYTKRHKDYDFPNGQRIDQVWFSGCLKPKECRIRPWGHEISPGSNIPFSDHEPVQVLFECCDEPVAKPATSQETIEKLGIEATGIFNQGISDLNKYQLFAVVVLGVLCAVLYVDICFIELPLMLNVFVAFVILLFLVFYVYQLMYTIPSEINKCQGAIANVATWPSDPSILLNDNR